MKADQNQNTFSIIDEQLSLKKSIIEGDVVRAYRGPFDGDQYYTDRFIQGVVIGIESCIKDSDYVKVKWLFEFSFGISKPFKMPHDGSDTFTISKSSPGLVKVNQSQLSLAL